MTRTDFNKYLLNLNLDKETFEKLQQLAMTMVSNGMTFEECAKIVEKILTNKIQAFRRINVYEVQIISKGW